MAITLTDFKERFDTDLSDSALNSWLSAADVWVSRIKDNYTDTLSTAEEDELKFQIAAHLASQQDKRIGSTSRETASVSYTGDSGMDWDSTVYGQTAQALDPTSTLTNSSKPKAFLETVETKDYLK